MNQDLCLDYLDFPSQKENAPLLILLHGRLANEEDLFEFAPDLSLAYRVLSVRAPIRMGLKAYGWFQSLFEPRYAAVKQEEFINSKKLMIEFISQVKTKYNLGSNPVFLLGFSQGAVLSLSIALEVPDWIAGVVCFNGCLMPELLSLAPNKSLHHLPVFVSHGLYDEILPVTYAREIKDCLDRLQVNLTYKEYPLGHEINDINFPDAREWLMNQVI